MNPQPIFSWLARDFLPNIESDVVVGLMCERKRGSLDVETQFRWSTRILDCGYRSVMVLLLLI